MFFDNYKEVILITIEKFFLEKDRDVFIVLVLFYNYVS